MIDSYQENIWLIAIKTARKYNILTPLKFKPPIFTQNQSNHHYRPIMNRRKLNPKETRVTRHKLCCSTRTMKKTHKQK